MCRLYPGTKYRTVYITKFYLEIPLDVYEFIRISIRDIPAEIIKYYNFTPLVHTSFVMVEIRKRMYELPQRGILANIRLQKHLRKHVYVVVSYIPVLFKHITRSISFTLVVNDFDVKYINTYDLNHLIYILQAKV